MFVCQRLFVFGISTNESAFSWFANQEPLLSRAIMGSDVLVIFSMSVNILFFYCTLRRVVDI
jgi:hypothetical protein